MVGKINNNKNPQKKRQQNLDFFFLRKERKEDSIVQHQYIEDQNYIDPLVRTLGAVGTQYSLVRQIGLHYMVNCSKKKVGEYY